MGPRQIEESFNEIAKGENCINMINLKYFLTKNGFEVQNPDIYAILRRCDRDGDAKLSKNEFQNLLQLHEKADSPREAFGYQNKFELDEEFSN